MSRTRGVTQIATGTPDARVIQVGPARITVVTARRPGQAWNTQARHDIQRARLSYQTAWGPVPVWDQLDELETTLNYIANVEYRDTNGQIVSEALSNRLVTVGGEDVAFYHVAGTPLREVFHDVLHKRRGAQGGGVGVDSRLGAIRPPKAAANAYTLDAWAALKLQMAADALELGIEYIAVQLRPELSEHVFSRDGVRFDFPPAEEVLGLPGGSIRLDRTLPLVVDHILRYPGYFLDASGLSRVMDDSIQGGLLSREEFEAATGLVGPGELRNPRNGRHLVGLLSRHDARAALLRERIVRDVPDGTYCSVARTDDYASRARRVLEDRHVPAALYGDNP